MVRKMPGSRKAGALLLVAVLAVVMFLLIGCQAAEGLKEARKCPVLHRDITFIGDKTAEILDK